MSPFLSILALSLFGSVLGLFGGICFLADRRLAKVLSVLSIPFAAGVLIATALTHLIPEAIEVNGEYGSVFVLIAFLASFFFEEFFANMHHHRDHKHVSKKHGSVELVLFGDTIHNFIDGVAIAAAYLTDPRLGVFVALATFLHEVPHEIGDFGVLVSHGWSRMKAIVANLLSALVTVVGATLTYLFAEQVEPLLGVLLAISAGVFLYLGASDFLPDLVNSKKGKRRSTFAALIAGVLVVILLSFFAPEH